MNRVNINTHQRLAVEKALEKRIPFALFSDPATGKFRFIASFPDNEGMTESRLDDPDWKGFFIDWFANDGHNMPGVEANLDEDSLLVAVENISEPFPEPLIAPSQNSTDRYKYLSIVKHVAEEFDSSRHKVVISRVIVETTDADIVDIAETYFSLRPDAFCYLAYTRDTGLWLGATPEVIFNLDLKKRDFNTMALAGTKRSDDETSWNHKNTIEQSIVVDDIVKALSLGRIKNLSVHKTQELRAGNVTHIMTPITGSIDSGITPMNLLRLLSPTAAVAGFPREMAVAKILVSETHDRHCYAGAVGVADGESVKAWANLRCCFIGQPIEGQRLINLYAGGGITSKSKAPEEWEETELKAAPLLEAINAEKKS